MARTTRPASERVLVCTRVGIRTMPRGGCKCIGIGSPAHRGDGRCGGAIAAVVPGQPLRGFADAAAAAAWLFATFAAEEQALASMNAQGRIGTWLDHADFEVHWDKRSITQWV